MRKLRPAERRFLEAIPRDIDALDVTLPGHIRPWEWPKGTNRTTVRNLYKMGYLKIVAWGVDELPLGLTPGGKAARTLIPEEM